MLKIIKNNFANIQYSYQLYSVLLPSNGLLITFLIHDNDVKSGYSKIKMSIIDDLYRILLSEGQSSYEDMRVYIYLNNFFGKNLLKIFLSELSHTLVIKPTSLEYFKDPYNKQYFNRNSFILLSNLKIRYIKSTVAELILDGFTRENINPNLTSSLGYAL